MKSSPHRSAYRWLLVLGVILLLISIGGFYFSRYVEKIIAEKIQASNGKTSSVNLSLLKRSLSLTDFEWRSRNDSALSTPHHIVLKEIRLQGIHWLSLLFTKELIINHLALDSGLVDFSTKMKQPSSNNLKPTFVTVSFKTLTLGKIAVCKLEEIASLKADAIVFELKDTATDNSIQKTLYSVRVNDALVKKIQIDRPEGRYSGTVSRVFIDNRDKRVTVDSILLIPTLDRYNFSRRDGGGEAARLNLSVPQVIIEELQFEELSNKSFIASSIKIASFDLFAYKDKRVPFLRKENRAMPMEKFLELPFGVKIDSVLIGRSRISIEEFPEYGTASGIIIFDAVEATFANLNNRILPDDSRYGVLKASGRLMNDGLVEAVFEFPLDGSAQYTANGSISKMNLVSLNPVVENMANMRVESGYLQNLIFSFNYTDYWSKGHLDMAYEDLIVQALDKNESTTNEIKTLLIRLFMAKNKSQSESLSKSAGVIDIKRDRKRFIFNVWWKSIQNGLQSSMRGNKQRDKDHEKK